MSRGVVGLSMSPQRISTLVERVGLVVSHASLHLSPSCSPPRRGQAPPPLLIKIAPDLTEQDEKDIAAVALSQGVDGLVVSNTTVERPEPVAESPNGSQAGGLSGAPLFERSTAVLGRMYRLTRGQLPIIGVGGVSSGEQAYRKICAGETPVLLLCGFGGAPPPTPRGGSRQGSWFGEGGRRSCVHWPGPVPGAASAPGPSRDVAARRTHPQPQGRAWYSCTPRWR